MNRRHIINIPSLSDYAWREIRAANATQRAKLNEKELKVLRDDTGIREFVDKVPLDYLLNVLTKLGKQWDLRIYDREEGADQVEFSVVNQFQHPEKRVDVIEAMVREKVYYMSAMDTMISAHMCAQNSHSVVFELSAENKKAPKRVRAISKLRMTSREETELATEAIDDLNRLLLNQLNSLDWALQTLGLEQNEVRILLSLFQKRHGAMTLAEIAAATVLDGKKAYLKKNMDKLMEDGLVISDAKHGPKTATQHAKMPAKTAYYMINAAGVEKMMQYRMHLHKITFGN